MRRPEFDYDAVRDLEFIPREVNHTTLPAKYDQGPYDNYRLASKDVQEMFVEFANNPLTYHSIGRLNEQDKALAEALTNKGTWQAFPLADKLFFPRGSIIPTEQSVLEQIAALSIAYGWIDQSRCRGLEGEYRETFHLGPVAVRFTSRNGFCHTSDGVATIVYPEILVEAPKS